MAPSHAFQKGLAYRPGLFFFLFFFSLLVVCSFVGSRNTARTVMAATPLYLFCERVWASNFLVEGVFLMAVEEF